MKHIQKGSQHALVIENDIPLAGIFAKALNYAGYRTVEIHDGQAALDQLRRAEAAPALVLLDFHLPFVSGEEILQFIRSDRRFSNTRVIMATADSISSDREIEQEVDLVLYKPISTIQLRDLALRLRCSGVPDKSLIPLR